MEDLFQLLGYCDQSELEQWIAKNGPGLVIPLRGGSPDTRNDPTIHELREEVLRLRRGLENLSKGLGKSTERSSTLDENARLQSENKQLSKTLADEREKFEKERKGWKKFKQKYASRLASYIRSKESVTSACDPNPKATSSSSTAKASVVEVERKPPRKNTIDDHGFTNEIPGVRLDCESSFTPKNCSILLQNFGTKFSPHVKALEEFETNFIAQAPEDHPKEPVGVSTTNQDVSRITSDKFAITSNHKLSEVKLQVGGSAVNNISCSERLVIQDDNDAERMGIICNSRDNSECLSTKACNSNKLFPCSARVKSGVREQNMRKKYTNSSSRKRTPPGKLRMGTDQLILRYSPARSNSSHRVKPHENHIVLKKSPKSSVLLESTASKQVETPRHDLPTPRWIKYSDRQSRKSCSIWKDDEEEDNEVTLSSINRPHKAENLINRDLIKNNDSLLLSKSKLPLVSKEKHCPGDFFQSTLSSKKCWTGKIASNNNGGEVDVFGSLISNSINVKHPRETLDNPFNQQNFSDLPSEPLDRIQPFDPSLGFPPTPHLLQKQQRSLEATSATDLTADNLHNFDDLVDVSTSNGERELHIANDENRRRSCAQKQTRSIHLQKSANLEIELNTRKRSFSALNKNQSDCHLRFEIDPKANFGVGHVFDEVGRGKHVRKTMRGKDCECCSGYYEQAAKDFKKVPGIDIREISDHQNLISRHRHFNPPPPTPPHYWQLGFPDTQQVDAINERAAELQQQKIKKMEAQACDGKGPYKIVKQSK
ncbi:expressed protein [Phakopsora pachyrhizi]|uniref:Expressed protein n=1 Tax=Phakopsora pachyrhizi TaxID=170000 RepID=A0AAV0BEN1_PHAPC|nr:expressed protein [Phakopsora pachyrhizi]